MPNNRFVVFLTFLILINFISFVSSDMGGGGGGSSGGGSSPEPLSIGFTVEPPPSTNSTNQANATSESSSIGILCPENLLQIVIKSKDSKPVSDVEIRLILYEPYQGLKQQKVTDQDGKAVFNMSKELDGKYQLQFEKTGYLKPDDVFFDFVHCKVETPPPVLDLMIPDKTEVGKEFIAKATKDSKACDSCVIVVKDSTGKEVSRFTTDKNGEAKISLQNKGTYELDLLDDKGAIAKKKTISVAPAPEQEQPPKIEPQPVPAPSPSPGPSPSSEPAPSGGSGTPAGSGTPSAPVVLDLTTPEKIEVGKEFAAKATKDGQACSSCTIVVKDLSGNQVSSFTTDSNGEAKISLQNKGSYELDLLTSEGAIAKKNTVSVELALGSDELGNKSTSFLDDPTVQKGLGIIAIVVVFSAVYLWWRGQSGKK